MGKKLIIAFILAALTCSTALGDERFKPFEKTGGVYIRLSDFYWDEHYDGEKLLDETGLLYTLGVTEGGLFSRGASFAPDVYRLSYGGTLEYFWGSVDYDGQTQAGQPVTTTVDYEGFRLEAYLGMLFKTKSKT